MYAKIVTNSEVEYRKRFRTNRANKYTEIMKKKLKILFVVDFKFKLA